jgi:hypothetical protein
MKMIEVGMGMGGVLAMIISWSVSSSILWALAHGLFGWFYILYFAINR